MVPVELSVKETISRARPLVGLAALSAVKTTTLLKLSSLIGVKCTTMLADPNPGRLKGMPDTMLNGPSLTTADPLVIGVVSRLLTTKAASAVVPSATAPKARPAGETANCGSARPMPLIALVMFPPLLAKTISLLKLVALVGVKATVTTPV